MKTILLASLLFVSPAVFACESLDGAWELGYAIYKDAQGKVVAEIKDTGEKSLKVLSQGHFSFITHDKDGKFSVAAGGTFTVQGGQYTEVVTYSSDARLLGKTYRFNCRLKDGMWLHTGNEDHLFIEERWKRAGS